MNIHEEPWVSGRISMDSQRNCYFIDKLSGQSLYVAPRSEVKDPDQLEGLILAAQERDRQARMN